MQADRHEHEWASHRQTRRSNRKRAHLRESLVRIGIEGCDRRNALEHAGGLLPGGSQLLAVPAPRREELDQHHPVRVQHLQSKPKRIPQSEITQNEGADLVAEGLREASQVPDLGFEIVGVELEDGGARGVECDGRGGGRGDEEERREESGTHGGAAKLLEAGEGEETAVAIGPSKSSLLRFKPASARGDGRVCRPIDALHV